MAVLGPAVVAAVLHVVRDDAGLPIQTLVLLSVVVATALVGGLWPALLAALLSGLTLNLVFIAPTGTLSISDPQNALALGVFLLIAVAVSSVVDRSARRTEEAMRARREADALADLARRLLHADDDPVELLEAACVALGQSGAAIWRSRADGRVEVEAASGTPPLPGVAAVRSTTIEPDVSLVLAGPALRPEDETLLTAYAGHLQVTRERQRSQARARLTAELTEGNRIRTALLAAVSHDLRSPLAAIKAAASSLRSGEVEWSLDDEAELLATIEDGADRLEHLVANLLDLSRLQTGAVTPLLADLELHEVVQTAIGPLPGADRVELGLDPGVGLVRADPGLVDRVVANLVANALSYGGAGPVRVIGSAETGPDGRNVVAVRVVDHGPGIAASDRGRLFQPFRRLGDAPAGTGLGLGLAVALGLTDAMGGTLRAEDTPGGGLTMVLTLPAGPAEVDR